MLRCGAVLSLVLSFASQLVSAQQTTELESGLKPFGSFHGGDIDSVSLSSGNVVLHIPLISYPQRGGVLRVNYFLRLNNKNWFPKFVSNPGGGFFQWEWGPKERSNGVSLVLDQPVRVLHTKKIIEGEPPATFIWYQAVTTDGASHGLEATQPFPVGEDIAPEYESVDGTGIKYVPNGEWSGTIVDRMACAIAWREQ